MSDKQARVSRYAQAVFQIMVEKWQSSLNEVTAAVARDESLAGLLADAGKDGATKVAALEASLPAGVPAEVANFVKLLAQEGDFSLLPQISAALSQTRKRSQRSHQGRHCQRSGTERRGADVTASQVGAGARRRSCLHLQRRSCADGRVARACGRQVDRHFGGNSPCGFARIACVGRPLRVSTRDWQHLKFTRPCYISPLLEERGRG